MSIDAQTVGAKSRANQEASPTLW